MPYAHWLRATLHCAVCSVSTVLSTGLPISMCDDGIFNVNCMCDSNTIYIRIRGVLGELNTYITHLWQSNANILYSTQSYVLHFEHVLVHTLK